MADGQWVLIDDRDPGIGIGPVPTTYMLGGVPQEYDGTTTGLITGDYLTYYFNASGIAVYGTYAPPTQLGPPVAVYQVDNIPATTVTAPITQQTLYRQNFWNITNLPPLSPGGFHSLVVTAISPNLTLWVDYLAYPPASLTISTTSSTPSPTPSSTKTENTPISTSVASSTGGGSSSSSIPGGTIAGIVVGACAFLLAAAVLILYLRRRHLRTMPLADDLLSDELTSPDMSQSTRAHPFSPSLPSSTQHTGASYTSVPQQPASPDEFVKPLPLVPVRMLDGGVSLLGGPNQIPPHYQEHYS